MDWATRLLQLLRDFETAYVPQVARRNAEYVVEYEERLRDFNERMAAKERTRHTLLGRIRYAISGDEVDRSDGPDLFQEADPTHTLAYLRLIMAVAAARIGFIDLARDLEKQAGATLHHLGHPVHVFLTRAFEARVEQAIAKLPIETTLLPAGVNTLLTKLAKFDRYLVDRTRQSLATLEVLETLDPIAAFQRGGEPRGELAALYEERDPHALAAALHSMIEKGNVAAESSTKNDAVIARQRVLRGAMVFLPMLEKPTARALLAEILKELSSSSPTLEAHIDLLKRAIQSAHRIDDIELAKQAFNLLVPLVVTNAKEMAWAPQTIGAVLAPLSKLGMSNEVERALEVIQTTAPASATGLAHVCARLDSAAYRARHGDVALVNTTFEEAFAMLDRNEPELPPVPRIELVRTLANALGSTPPEYCARGLDRLMLQASYIHDCFATNHYLCLHPLILMESVALAHVEIARVNRAN